MDKNLIIAKRIEESIRKPFVWGENDCCMWVSDLVKEIHRIEIARPFKGYQSEFGSKKKLHQYCGKASLLIAAIKRADELNLKQVERFSFDKNLVSVITNPSGNALAVWHKAKWVARTQTGIAFLEPHVACIAWEIE